MSEKRIKSDDDEIPEFIGQIKGMKLYIFQQNMMKMKVTRSSCQFIKGRTT
jgi:hypothetical protein